MAKTEIGAEWYAKKANRIRMWEEMFGFVDPGSEESLSGTKWDKADQLESLEVVESVGLSVSFKLHFRDSSYMYEKSIFQADPVFGYIYVIGHPDMQGSWGDSSSRKRTEASVIPE